MGCQLQQFMVKYRNLGKNDVLWQFFMILSAAGENNVEEKSVPASSGATCNSMMTITSSQIQVSNQPLATLQQVNTAVSTVSGGIPQDVLALVRNQQALDAQRGHNSAQMLNTILNHYVNK